MRARVRQPAHAVQLHVITVEPVPPAPDLVQLGAGGNMTRVEVTGEISVGERTETVIVTAELPAAQVPVPGQLLAARMVHSSPPRVWVEWPGVEPLPLTGPTPTLKSPSDEPDSPPVVAPGSESGP